MIASITRNAIKTLPASPPSSTKKFIWDVHLPGFGVYKTSRGSVSFIYQYRMSGCTHSIFLGTMGEMTIEQAREKAMAFAQQRRAGVDPREVIRAARDKERTETEMLMSVYAENYLSRRIADGNACGFRHALHLRAQHHEGA